MNEIWARKVKDAMNLLGCKSENSAKPIDAITAKTGLAKDAVANIIREFVNRKEVIEVGGKKRSSYYLAQQAEEELQEEEPQEGEMIMSESPYLSSDTSSGATA